MNLNWNFQRGGVWNQTLQGITEGIEGRGGKGRHFPEQHLWYQATLHSVISE